MGPLAEIDLPPQSPVTGVRHDSRRVGPGDVFVCLRGQHQDGAAFAAQARARGALLCVAEEELPDVGPVLRVHDARKALALLSCAFFDHPSRSFSLTGVTGTNGKTSITWMLDSVHRAAGRPSALLGTLGSGSPGSDRGPAMKSAVHTTPEAPDLQEEFARWREAGIASAVMEVSSHALAQRRSYGTRFACAVFTNLSVDHLDYHGDLESYREAKARLFRREERGVDEPSLIAAVNDDDPAARKILEGSDDFPVRFGIGSEAHVRAREIACTPEGTRLSVEFSLPSNLPSPAAGSRGSLRIESPLLGTFQASNLLAASAAALALGIAPEAVARGLQTLRGVPGRMERVDQGQPFRVLVDYAHTPDALSRALASLRPFTPGRLIVVFGCGGDRDSTKRPAMGEAAGLLADVVVLTDDNPRTEDPEAIRGEVRRGLASTGKSFREIGDREEAIRTALAQAGPGDTVLLAGKGHERVQIRGVESIPFDDREVAARILKEKGA